MRPTSRPQSALQAPFNTILGTETNIRVLRVLAALGGPLSPSEVARRVALEPSGVRRALHALAATGIIEFTGTGMTRQVQLRHSHPLAHAIIGLFKAEVQRFQAIQDRITETVKKLKSAPKAVWVDGAVADETDTFEDPISVGVLADSGNIGKLLEDFQSLLSEVERSLDVTIELHGWTLPDMKAIGKKDSLKLINARPLFGLHPAILIDNDSAKLAKRKRNIAAHGDLDEQARALGEAISNKLAYDPSLVGRTRERVVQLLDNVPPGQQRELQEWLHILDTMSLSRLRQFLVSSSERAIRLRQSLPFLDVLSAKERNAAIEKAG